MNIQGTVSTSSAVIYKETSACYGAVYCSIPAITGPHEVCPGFTITLADAETGGTWSSGSTSIATVVSSTGVVTGVAAGTATIVYTDPCARTATYVVTVNPKPDISGTATMCVGFTTTLSPSIGGGTWSSLNTGVATVGASTGIVTGIAAGTVNIVYTLGTGCADTVAVTVKPLPAAISGTLSICLGVTTTLSSATAGGGTWLSSNTSVATIGSASGSLFGAGIGTSTITFTSSITGCYITAVVSVVASPVSISGSGTVCEGGTTAFTVTPSGGTWSSVDAGIATIGSSSGLVTGVAGPATVVISYTLPDGCFGTEIVTVNPVPADIAGILHICAGATTTLTDATSGGTWSSSTPSIATVGSSSGIVTGISAGTATISYTLTSTGCYSTGVVTIDPLPVISYLYPVCEYATETIFVAASGGSGTWSSTSTSIATVGSIIPPGYSTVTGVSAGTTIITYTSPLGCVDTAIVTVLPNAVISPPDPIYICEGTTIALSASISGGTWGSYYSALPVPGTISSTGVVTGLAEGWLDAQYTLPNGCVAHRTVSVKGMLTGISGPGAVCVGGTITLTSVGTTLGAWVSSTPTVGTIYFGAVHGLSAGTTTISFTSMFGPGACSGGTATRIVTVYANPTPITGSAAICPGDTITLSDGVAGGTWSSSNTSVATIGSTSGLLIGISSGTTTITYTIGGICITTEVITVKSVPTIGAMLAVCPGLTILLSATPPGGTWSSGSLTIGTVGSTSGVLTGIATGSTIITYTSPTSGCTTTAIATVLPLPAAITGTLSLCVGYSFTTTLSDATPGGTWSSSSPSIADIVASTGAVTGISPGTATITYTISSTGCYKTATVTVNPTPTSFPPTTVCTGTSTTLVTSPTGGTWSSTIPAVGIVDAFGSVTGITVGTTVISYILGTGCYTSTVVTVIPSPAPITGILVVCEGSVTILSDTSVGGTWTCGPPMIGSIDASGHVTGLMGGVLLVTYTMPNGCFSSAMVTVNPLPPITGIPHGCVGATSVLTSPLFGGTWSSSTPSVGTIGSTTGVVGGISVGTTIVTYIVATGCFSTVVVTVDPSPGPIMGALEICRYATTTLYDTVSGGTWSASDLVVIELFPYGDTADIYGSVAGTSIVTYTLPTGCSVTATVTVDPVPDILGTLALCEGGNTTMLTPSISGGTWASGTTSVATITSGGLVTSGSPGTSIITYTLPTGCRTMVMFTTNPLPATITGTTVLCVSDTATLHSSPTGGIWNSSAPGIAGIGITTGLMIGISTGTANITYILPTGCRRWTTVTVNTTPLVAPITGGSGILCVGGADTLDDATPGGVWTSSNPAVVGTSLLPITSGIPGIVINGISTGTAVISYTVTNDCGSTSATYTVTVLTTPTVSAITGILGVCSDYTDTLYASPAGGVWSSSAPGIASVSSTGVVSGILTGSVTISYTVTNPCGSVIATVNVVVNMEPYITTNFIVACSAYTPPSDGVHPGLLIGSGCNKVCDSTTVRYYANGVAGSAFTWRVAGGTVVADYGDSIDVFWSTVGLIGSITLYDTFTHCIDSARACIKIIDKPHADFSMPSTVYCQGSNIVFTDHSTGDPSSPIVSWYWNFGDGTSSSAPGSANHVYAGPRTFTVTLTVKNACNCTDSFRQVLTVEPFTGPAIVCPSVVCDSDYVTYHTTASCSTYNWSVVGGTIISGAGTSSIRIHWDMADASGFGQITLETPGCSLCDHPTTIKIPIILQSPEIAGNDTICVNSEYLYQLPLWPATDYTWGVIDSPAAIPTWRRHDYKVGVFFGQEGTYTIHARYQNRITLCGGNIFKTITVLPPSSILGQTTICAGATETYSLTGGYLGNWKLSNAAGTGWVLGSGTTFSYAFTDPGTYILYASGGFCADPITITVMSTPIAVDSLIGEDTVCLGRYYSYSAGASAPGNVFKWEAIGGDVSPESGPDVTVQWTSTGTKQLRVRRLSQTPPYCPGADMVMNIIEEPITPNVTGNINPCPNTGADYSANYNRAEVYDWAIYPNTAGSVVSGNHSPNMSVLWNNTAVAITATVVVTVRKCDSVKTDSLQVNISTGPPIAFDSVTDDTVCPRTPITFYATVGGASYRWDFGDGTHQTGGSYATHKFPVNTTSSSITYHVTVYSSGGCPPTGTVGIDVTILPGPSVYLLTHSDDPPCTSGDTVEIEAIASTNVTISSYTWYASHASATPTTYYAWSAGPVSVLVTASNGCTAAATGGFHCDSAVSPCSVGATITTACDLITLSAGGGTASGSWYPLSGTGYTPTTGNPATVTVHEAGVYRFQFDQAVTHCLSSFMTAYVYAVADFKIQFKCGTSGMDTIYLTNLSSTLPDVTSISYSWTNPAPTTVFSTATNPTPIWAAQGSTLTIGLLLTGMHGSTPISCYVEKTFSVPDALTVGFTVNATPVCSKVPVFFTPTYSDSPNRFFWDFDDGASLLLREGKREFTFNLSLADPNLRFVTLSVSDIIGCTASHTELVEVYQNRLDGSLGSDQILCSSAAPVTLSYVPIPTTPTPVQYLWSNAATTATIPVYKSGTFWVTVRDGYRCQATIPLPPTPAVKVKVIQTPRAEIRGPRHYCIGDAIDLDGFVGDNVDYQWYVNGSVFIPFGYHPHLSPSTSVVTSYDIQLEIRTYDTASLTYCYDISSVYTIYIHGLPDPPSISGPIAIDCGIYHLQLTASEPVSGTYNWSNGSYGPVDDIYVGGAYRVWFTNLWGCINSSDVYVPLAPNTFFPYFPSGCYEICEMQLPLVLKGEPYEPFDTWAWLKNYSVVLSGAMDTMSSYTVTDVGVYNWALGNGLCIDTSESMDLSTIPCADCQSVGLTATLVCDSLNPQSYAITVSFNTTSSDTHYILGTDIGPITPFSGTVPIPGIHTLSLVISLITCFIGTDTVFAQTPKWLRGGATNQDFSSYNFQEEALFMCSDQSRNIYTLSIIGNTAITADTFSRPTGAYGSPKNVLLTSHNCNGQMRFAKLITSNSTVPCGVVADNAGHIYLAVDVPHYSTSSLTTLRVGYDTTITTHTNSRIALIQFDTVGHLNWLRYVGENTLATFNAMGGSSNFLALDGSDNPHIVVATNYGANLTPSLISHVGFYDVGYNMAGTLLSINKLQIDSSLLVSKISIDKQSGKLYAFGARNISSFPDSSRYPFIAALDVSRNRIWIDTVANPYYPNGAGFTSIACDNIGHVYCTVGASRGFVYRGDTALNVFGIPNAITTIVKMDTAGDPKWMRVYSSTVSSGVSNVKVMPNNKVAVCGSIAGGKIVTGTDTLYAFPGEGQNAIYSIVDSAGYVQTFQQMHGAGFYDGCNVSTSDNVGNLYLAGKVENNIWGGSLSPYTTVGGDSDYFIMKYGVDCNCTSMPVANYSYSGTYLSRSFSYTGTMTGIDSVRWTFGDGGTSTSLTPVHSYTGAGTFTTCVRVYSACGNDMRCHEITTTCMSTPTSSYTDTGNAVHGFTYTGTTAGIDSVRWDFGDGTHSTGLTPIHTFAVADTYHVCATVYTNCGSHTWCKDVIVTGTGTLNVLSAYSMDKVLVFPNPATNELYVSGVVHQTDYRLTSIVGSTLQSGTLHAGTNILQTQQLPSGIYMLEMTDSIGGRKVVRIVKQ